MVGTSREMRLTLGDVLFADVAVLEEAYAG